MTYTQSIKLAVHALEKAQRDSLIKEKMYCEGYDGDAAREYAIAKAILEERILTT